MKLTILSILIFLISCTNQPKPKKESHSYTKGTYGYDLAVLKKHTKSIELKSGDACIVVSPEYQGRVMTSTASGLNGMSYGWINHDLIASGEIQKGINPVGGEERFWLGPEGGQFSIFFPEGSDFDFSDWQTPACIDSDTFDVLNTSDSSVEFSKDIVIRNYSNFEFDFNVNRQVSLLDNKALRKELGIVYQDAVKSVAYTTRNTLTNTGDQDWKKESGLLSIWLLGMFNPSPEVTILVPYKEEAESDYIVKDDYFGKVPSDRLLVKDGMVLFKGDGKKRGKIGIPPQRALPVIGSYDAANQLLTVVKCEIPEGIKDYVNSAWELQENPYGGDAINSYNDGPLEDGGQLGPFYELETSSPALALKAGEAANYSQTTAHFQGSEEELNALVQQLFGLSLNEIKSVF